MKICDAISGRSLRAWEKKREWWLKTAKPVTDPENKLPHQRGSNDRTPGDHYTSRERRHNTHRQQQPFYNAWQRPTNRHDQRRKGDDWRDLQNHPRGPNTRQPPRNPPRSSGDWRHGRDLGNHRRGPNPRHPPRNQPRRPDDWQWQQPRHQPRRNTSWQPTKQRSGREFQGSTDNFTMRPTQRSYAEVAKQGIMEKEHDQQEWRQVVHRRGKRKSFFLPGKLSQSNIVRTEPSGNSETTEHYNRFDCLEDHLSQPVIINICNRELSKDEISVLQKGAKFTPIPKRDNNELKRDVTDFCRKLRLKEYFEIF